MQNLILIGGGGHAKSCIDIVLSTSLFKILGYVDLEKSLDEKYAIPYLGQDDVLPNYVEGNQFLITIGQIDSSEKRERIFNDIKALGGTLAKVISPNAQVSNFATIGEGSIVFHGVTVQADASIGHNCIINNHALVEHDCQIGNHCHISTNAVVNGNVNLSNGVFIGSSAVLKQGISIGEKAVIGMGSVVLRNVESQQVVFGNPAKSK
jgi:sugar O-acyltransferase (sialic acid O-acetyltransferase NeuD family)